MMDRRYFLVADKKGFKFNIVKNDPLDGHKGTNIGSISLDNIAPVFIDVENKDAFIDPFLSATRKYLLSIITIIQIIYYT